MQIAIVPAADDTVQPYPGTLAVIDRYWEDARDTASEEIRELLGNAIAALTMLFERGADEANAVTPPQRLRERIAGHRYGLERRYAAGVTPEDLRFVSLFVSVPASDGHRFGGAYINSSRTLPSIFLVPQIVGDRVSWVVSATGTPFGAQLARDLFAAVFGDDARAVARLEPLVGYDLFQTPWS